MTTTFTTEMKIRLLRFLADGMSTDDVAEEFGCQATDVVGIARNHGYPDREKLAKAASIIEANLAAGKVAPPPQAAVTTQPLHTRAQTAPAGGQPTNVGDLLRTARQHPSTRKTKTERQRAEEALAVARRRLDKLRDQEKALDKQLKQVKNDRVEAERIHTYRADHPALEKSTTPTQEEGTA